MAPSGWDAAWSVAPFALAIGLGLLVGVQRERAASALAGVRTFPLITALGAMCAMLGDTYGGWVIAAGMLAVAAAIVIGNVAKMRGGVADPGLTTEIAMLLMFAVGAAAWTGPTVVAVALTGAVMALLHAKAALHGFVERMGEEDARAIVQFVLISLVILPVLPDTTFGPYGVLNPRNIWLMVVLVVGISLLGYVAHRLMDKRLGFLVGGALGGLVSSTATTASFSRRAGATADLAGVAAVVIMLATCIMLVRVLVEVAVVAPGFLKAVGPPIGALLGVGALTAGVLHVRARHSKVDPPTPSNPGEFKTALLFGGLYAIVLVAAAAAKDEFESLGLYAVAGISGLTDMDAITLSTARLVEAGQVSADVGWRAIVIASMSNLVFKGWIAATLGGRRLAMIVLVAFGVSLAASAGVLVVWGAPSN